MTRVLGLFAKYPQPGKVKTRLAQETTPELAARIAEAFLRDSVARLARIKAHRVLAYTPAVFRSYFADLTGGLFSLVPQSEGSLGRRMKSFLQTQLDQGAESVVLLGTDSPTLPLEYIEDAFDELTECDVVIGPATDGGYYLLGCTRVIPRIFENTSWGGSQVLRQTVAHIQESQLRLSLLPPWYDVDSLADWEMLQGHVLAMRATGVVPGIPNTEQLLR